MWKLLNSDKEMQNLLIGSVMKERPKRITKKVTRKVIEAFLRFFSSVAICYPRTPYVASEKCRRLEELPNEILLKILSYCDFTSKMNMRAVNYRLYSLVETGAFTLVRRNLIGGVEIREGDTLENTYDPGIFLV
ncbi:hypothetical protein Y032_0887g2865 [Ancylostoma ceylanicum]|uniref:F-box domain-containing protein n=1 Tax=Ancylostoma ceylanicum TaxID=53326 RepID=A0A016WBZ6_9BILA|nr:hypothetical protein Y032_0887g2865 [Ancylostoma ceylanicum]